MTYEKLFTPIKINSMVVPNRTVMGPMGTGYASRETNFPTDRMAHYYGERAKGGTGLIIVEQSVVQKRGLWSPQGGGLWSDDSIPYWKKVVEEVQKHGSKIAIQIGHLGRSTTSAINGGYQPIAPSPVADHLLQQTPQEMTIEDIETFKEDYLNAVKRAVKAGFDAIEIHCTHGYLIASFLSGRTNKRTDRYGGTLEGRLCLPIEIIKMVRKEVGEDYPLLARLATHEANNGRTVEESKVVAKALVEAGLDALDLSAGSFSELDWEIPPYYFGPANNMVNIEAIKKSVKVPVIGSGRFTEPRLADQLIAEDRLDMVGINRAVIADPYWSSKAEAGKAESIRRCIGCTKCIDELFSSEEMVLNCTVNPFVGKENTISIEPAADKKKVLVAGGGPAGLQAASIAAQRGHDVILAERNSNLGGQVRPAASPPLKYEISSIVTWLEQEAIENGVEIIMNQAVDEEYAKKVDPDVLIIATGAKSATLNIPGIDGAHVMTAVEVLSGQKDAGLNVAVIGAGMIGVETAIFLAEYGKLMLE